MPASQEAALSSRFYIQIGDAVQGVFTEIGGLQMETEVVEFREGGNNSFVYRLPGQTSVGNLTLKHGLVSSSQLFKWYVQVAQGKIERQNISVMIYSTAGDEIVRWNLINAYPIRWVGPLLTSDNSGALVETVELAHEGLQVE